MTNINCYTYIRMNVAEIRNLLLCGLAQRLSRSAHNHIRAKKTNNSATFLINEPT
jgi:hypothetical protein